MRFITLVLVCFFACAGTAIAKEPAALRLALVIGNGDYDRDGRADTSKEAAADAAARRLPPDLANTLNDANDIGGALARLGYAVDRVENGDLAEMQAAADAFRQKVIAAPRESQVVVYFAGHGANVAGTVYMIATGAVIPQEMPQDGRAFASERGRTKTHAVMETFGVPLSRVLEGMPSRKEGGFILILLDTCRDSPWENLGITKEQFTPGYMLGHISDIARILQSTTIDGVRFPDGGLVGLSTSAGRMARDSVDGGRNGPYAAALLKVIDRKDLTITQMMAAVHDDIYAATRRRQDPKTFPLDRLINTVCVADCGPDAHLSAETKAPKK